jgi:hypothetical protein
MEKRVNLFMQGMVLFISLLLSVLIAVSITTQREDENRELLEYIRVLFPEHIHKAFFHNRPKTVHIPRYEFHTFPLLVFVFSESNFYACTFP